MFGASVHEGFARGAVKGFFRVRRKGKRRLSERSALAGVFLDEAIERFSVVRRDVFDVGGIFQTPFDLKTADSGLDKFTYVPALVVVF